MNDFHSNFQACFTEEERESEIYRILASIGVNVEKALYEEINAEIRRSSEPMVFTDQKLRSWLSFFLTPVRNVISATGTGNIELVSGAGSVTLPVGYLISGRNGKDYEIQEALTFSGVGSSSVFSFIQGAVQKVEGQSYSEFMSIPIASRNVDLSDIKVNFTSTFAPSGEVPLVAPFPAYPDDIDGKFKGLLNSTGLSSGDKGQILSFLGNNLSQLNSLWSSVSEVSVRPCNGFFPFYYNNVLYIKIYPGADVPIPDGRPVYISYRVSDGKAGNLKKDQLEDFSYTYSGQQYSFRVFNDEVTNGVNPPSHAELANLLRRRFFSSTHVSSVPEYTTWFLSQPGIGDCLVLSDYERWRMLGSPAFSGKYITGSVEVFLLDSDGGIINPVDSTNHLVPEIKVLDDKLADVRDIAFLKYTKPSVFWHYYIIQFRAVSDEANFVTSARSALDSLYSVDWVLNNNTSLFKDLDLDLVTRVVRGSYDPVGLRVIPYHYHEYKYNINFSGGAKVLFASYFGEKPGGWYEYWKYNDGFDFEEGPVAVFREYLGAAGNSCTIYRYKKKIKLVNGEPCGWDWSELDGDVATANVGSRSLTTGKITFNFKNLPSGGVLRCFWAIANEGMMPVGGDVTKEFGVRKLPSGADDFSGLIDGIENEKTFFDTRVHFEKYI